MRRLVALPHVLWALAACTNDFPPYSHIHSLSVLAVVAEPPEVPPGGRAALRALVVDPAGGGRPVTFDWAMCTLAPSGYATVNDRCVTEASGPFLIPLGDGATAGATMPAVRLADLGLPDASDGFYVPVRLLVRAGDETVTAIYRLRYGIGTPANHNPSLADFVAEDQGGGSYALGARLDAGAAEDYQVYDFDAQAAVTRREQLRFSWFTTAGFVSDEHTGADAPRTQLTVAAGGPVDVWVVVRDERGGSDYRHLALAPR